MFAIITELFNQSENSYETAWEEELRDRQRAHFSLGLPNFQFG